MKLIVLSFVALFTVQSVYAGYSLSIVPADYEDNKLFIRMEQITRTASQDECKLQAAEREIKLLRGDLKPQNVTELAIDPYSMPEDMYTFTQQAQENASAMELDVLNNLINCIQNPNNKKEVILVKVCKTDPGNAIPNCELFGSPDGYSLKEIDDLAFWNYRKRDAAVIGNGVSIVLGGGIVGALSFIARKAAIKRARRKAIETGNRRHWANQYDTEKYINLDAGLFAVGGAFVGSSATATALYVMDATNPWYWHDRGSLYDFLDNVKSDLVHSELEMTDETRNQIINTVSSLNLENVHAVKESDLDIVQIHQALKADLGTVDNDKQLVLSGKQRIVDSLKERSSNPNRRIRSNIPTVH